MDMVIGVLSITGLVAFCLAVLFTVETLAYWDISNSLSKRVAIIIIIAFVTICVAGAFIAPPVI